MTHNTVLVAGVSGVVGYAAAKHFAALDDWDVIGVARRPPDDLEDVRMLSVDLTDPAACRTAFTPLRGVTHLIYAALYERPNLIAGWREAEQIETNDQMLQNLFEPLQDAATGLRHVTLLQGTKAYGGHVERFRAPARERDSRYDIENFYWRQEDYLREARIGAAWRWTIVRPQIIFGRSLGSAMNLIPALGVYAALLAADGEPLHFPGGPPSIQEAVDADLLARMMHWAAVDEAAHDEIFNVTNGDVFVWENVWLAIADALGMEPGERRPISMTESVATRGGDWDTIRQHHGLRSPSIDAFVGKSFQYADAILGTGASPDRVMSPSLV
ncbi:MAG: SDR family oxidoreductase, partial [Actinomycetia bacterium]|nr:SDR family oxidoreductase [Actinomycetes bacterium]